MKRLGQLSLLFAVAMVCLTAYGLPGNPPISNPWLTVNNYYYDPANVSTHAFDSNNCTSASTPCLTAKQLNYRMGGISPRTTTSIVVNIMSSNIGLGDAINFTPCVSNSTFMALEGQLTQVGSNCAISALTPRNIVSTGSISQLKVTASCITTTAQFVINVTHPSRAWVRSNVSGSTWVMTQPLNQCDAATNTCPRTENNSWTNGDTISVWTMPQLDVDHFGTRCGSGAGYVGATHIAFAGSGTYIDGPFPVLWEDEVVSGATTEDGPWGEAVNVYHKGGNFNFHADITENIQAQWAGIVPGVAGGFMNQGAIIQGAYMGLGVDVGANAAIYGVLGQYNTTASDVYLEGTTNVLRPSVVFTGAQIWGPGILQEQPGAIISYYLGNATAAFLNGFAATGGPGYAVSFGPVTTGVGCTSQYTTAGTIATTCGVSLTPAHFEAAYPTGCFENCWMPGGFAIAAIQ